MSVAISDRQIKPLRDTIAHLRDVSYQETSLVLVRVEKKGNLGILLAGM